MLVYKVGEGEIQKQLTASLLPGFVASTVVVVVFNFIYIVVFNTHSVVLYSIEYHHCTIV